MNRLLLRNSPNWPFLALLGIGITLVVVLSACVYAEGGSAPSAQDAYPPPGSPTVFSCGAMSFSQDYPAAKQTREVAQCQTREAALKNPLPTPNPNPVYTGVPKEAHTDFYPSQRPAGIGTIIESSFAPFSAFYIFENQWQATIGNRVVTVYAGAQQQEEGKARGLPKPWPSIIIVQVHSTDNSPVSPSEDGYYYLPVVEGLARIVDAEGSRLVVVTQAGTAFDFDLETRQFTARTGPVQRSASGGTIIENGLVPFDTPGYSFENQWQRERGGQLITLLAGSQVINGWETQPALFIAVTRPGQPLKLSDGVIYLLPQGRSIRIVGASGDRLVLATDYEIVFDATSRQIVSPPGVALQTPLPVTAAPMPTAAPATLPPEPTTPPTPALEPTSYP